MQIRLTAIFDASDSDHEDCASEAAADLLLLPCVRSVKVEQADDPAVVVEVAQPEPGFYRLAQFGWRE